MLQRELIIENFIQGYNYWDADLLVRDLAPDVKYENTTDPNVYMSLKGITHIRDQFNEAHNIFKYRSLIINSIRDRDEATEVDFNYECELARPIKINGLDLNTERFSIPGKLLFTFKDESIVEILFFLESASHLNNII